MRGLELQEELVSHEFLHFVIRVPEDAQVCFAVDKDPEFPLCDSCTQVQKAAASGRSHVQLYRQLAKLRREASFQRGTMQFVRVTEDMLAFARHSARLPGYVVLLNFGEAACRYDEKAVSIEGHSYTTGVVVFVTADVDLRMGEKIKLNDITLNPGDGIVVKLTE